jgi:hypothetical protein
MIVGQKRPIRGFGNEISRETVQKQQPEAAPVTENAI